VEQAGVGHGLEERPGQLAREIDLVGAGSDAWSKLPGCFEGR
jgi:hypothetical protein